MAEGYVEYDDDDDEVEADVHDEVIAVMAVEVVVAAAVLDKNARLCKVDVWRDDLLVRMVHYYTMVLLR